MLTIVVDLKAAISGTMCTNSVQMILYLMAEKHFGFPYTSRSTEHVSKGGERCKYGISIPAKASCSCDNNQSLLFKDVSPIIIVVLYFSNNPRVQSIMEPGTF